MPALSNEQRILSHFGGLSNNSLSEMLNSTDQSDPTSSFLTESPYIDTSVLSQHLSKYSDNFTVMNLNIQSLNAKFDGLQTLISGFRSTECLLPLLFSLIVQLVEKR